MPLDVGKHLLAIMCFWFALLVASCGNGSTGMVAEPKRPQNVPAKAIWVGGPDGGVFVVIEKRKETEPHVYYAEIYYESGELWYKGGLALEPPRAPFPDPKQHELLSGWDGDALYLVDGRVLRPIDLRKRRGGNRAVP